MVTVDNLKYRYPLTEELALKGVSLEIASGEFIGVIGPNMAGKSTLCQALVGLVPQFYHGAYGGRVIIDGLDAAHIELSKLASKVGIVFQNPFTQVTGAKMTVYDEVAFGLENMGLARTEMIRRIDEALTMLDIYEFRSHNPFDLSGGQMQRMAIASIIAMRPQVIIFDEPTSQLDPQGSEEVFKAVRSLSRQGMTIIMVEHKIEKIAKYADRVLLLHQGRVVDFDRPQKVFSRPDLENYGVTAPVFTNICKGLNITDKTSGLYPVTLDDTYRQLRANNSEFGK
ncbi:MAG TPA: cobalt ABC transporter ATP-binding protein [Firmicutes bacterium]|nr:cobalt ABC transporter ATP-binding protein [Bacillota bacterium]